jgi:hypothetical protein
MTQATTTLTRPRSGPGHGHLRGLAAGAASHAWRVAVQPDLDLKGVEVAPRARKAVMHQLTDRTTTRAGQPRALADDLEADAPRRGIELDLRDLIATLIVDAARTKPIPENGSGAGILRQVSNQDQYYSSSLHCSRQKH